MNDIFSNKFDNELDEKTCKIASSKVQDLANKTFESKPFEHRHRYTITASRILRSFANLLSAFTVSVVLSYLLYLNFLPTFGANISIFVSISFGVLLALILEAFKRVSLDGTIKNIVVGKFNVLASFIGFTLVCVSVLLSFYGAKILPQITENSSRVEAVNVDSLKNSYQNRIEEKKKEKINYFESNKKVNSSGGYRLSSRLMPTYNKMIDRVEKLEIEYKSELEKAKIANNKKTELKTEQKRKNGSLLGYVAISFELIFLLSSLYYFYALKLVVVQNYATGTTEKGIGTQPEQLHVASPPDMQSISFSQNGVQRPKIGFNHISKVDIATCKHSKCNETFDKNKYPKNKKFCSAKCRVAHYKSPIK